MQIRNRSELPKGGRLIVLYADGGEGKTTGYLLTAPEPQLLILCEDRPIEPVIAEAERIKGSSIDCDWVDVVSFDELIEFLCTDTDKFNKYNSVLLDGSSSLMNIKLFGEILDEAFNSYSDKLKGEKPLIMQAKMSEEGYGALGRQMLRIIGPLGRIAKMGKVVVITSLLKESPRWNRALSAAPAFGGKFFSENYQGEVDLIGKLEGRRNEDGSKKYPPLVHFESDGSFVAKWSGIPPKDGPKVWPLNIEKIIRWEKK